MTNIIDTQLKALQGRLGLYPEELDIVRTSLETVQRETADDICNMLDKIESQDENTSMEQWKQYKHMRNAIRDKYVL